MKNPLLCLALCALSANVSAQDNMVQCETNIYELRDGDVIDRGTTGADEFSLGVTDAVSISCDGSSITYTNAAGARFHQVFDPATQQPVWGPMMPAGLPPFNGLIRTIMPSCAGNANAYLLDMTGGVWESASKTGQWVKVGQTTGTLDCDGGRFYVNNKDGIRMIYNGAPNMWNRAGFGGSTTPFTAATAKQTVLSCIGNANSYVLDTDGNVWELVTANGAWSKVGSQATKIICDGTRLYAQRTDGKRYIYNGAADVWQEAP